jgi:type I restriction enzyme S subunit
MNVEMITATDHSITQAGLTASSSKIIPAGEVVIASRVGLGKVCILGQDTAINQDLRGLVPISRKALDRRFLYYWYKSAASLVVDAGTGATVQGVTLPFLKALPIPLPPLEEQQRIVAILDEAFEGLARARAHAEANLQNAREFFESFLADLFVQENWQTRTLSEFSENLDRLRVPITKSDRISGDVPYFGASGVVDHVAKHIFDEDLLLVSEDGANLLARTYPIAFSISGKSWVNNHAHVLRFCDIVTQEYVRLYLNSISLEPYVSGMAQPKLNQAQLNRIPIPFPCAEKRADIVAKADNFSSQTEELKHRYQVSLASLDALRQSLLQKAFAGELT